MRTQQMAVTRGLFGLLSMGAAAVAGYFAYDWTSSWWLVAFVAMMVLSAVGRAIPDLITDPEKGRRLVFFGTPIALAVGALAGAYAIWSTWWLAVVIGFAVGGIGWGLVSIALPDIARQEQEDSMRQLGGELPQSPTLPPQFAAPPIHQPLLDPQLAQVFRATREAGVTFTPDEERAIIQAHAAGNDEEVARLIESKLPKVPAGA